MTNEKQSAAVRIGLVLVGIGAVVALALLIPTAPSTPAPSPGSTPGEGATSDIRAGANPAERATPDASSPQPESDLTLTEAESLQGSIKSVSCFPERAGDDVLSNEELTPTREGIQAMEGCMDLVGLRHPDQAAIQLTTVFYLSPDGTVTQTGVGADVRTPEAWDLLEPCARDYWLANAPRVRPSDEKSFSCTYSWSKWSLTGGVHRVGAHIPSVLSGRGTHAFGTSVTDF